MTRETCATCRFWVKRREGGSCRRVPPVWAGDGTAGIEPGWAFPYVDGGGWCGEHQPVAPAPAASDDYTRAGMAWAEAQARLIGAQIRLGRAAAALDGEDGIDVDLEPFGEAVTEARIANDDAEAAFLRLYRERHHAP